MFLYIACFFKGEVKKDVIALFDNYGFRASNGLRILEDKALISIDYNGKLWMHNLVQQMGWEIVRRENIKEPGRRSQLWNPNDIYDVLMNNQGTEAIEAIILDLSKISDIQLSAHTFERMTNLRFLKFYLPWGGRSCIVNFPSGLKSFPNRLRYFQWDNFPLESLPLTFCAKYLVELTMQNSRVKKLWDGVQDLVNLKKINLSGSTQLIELPDFSKAQNLEWVDLSFCESLCHLHPSILSVQRFFALSLHSCINLRSLPSESHLKSLNLDVDFCFSLEEFPLWSEQLIHLSLHNTGIEILDSSIGRLSNLMIFSLNGSTLMSLPSKGIYRLRSITELHLYNCEEMIDERKLHILFEDLPFLQEIYLEGSCNLTELPDNIKHLSRLRVLSLSNCKKLQFLPELPPSIEELEATNCTSLETLLSTSYMEFSLLPEERVLGFTPYSSIGYLRNLKQLTLSDCRQLYELPDNIGSLSSLNSLQLDGSSVRSLPASIKHLSKLDYIDLSNCRSLRSLPELPPFIRYVRATNCVSLETAFSSTASTPLQKYMVDFLFFENCWKLEEHSLSYIMECSYLSLKRGAYFNEAGAVCYPGNKVPEGFRYNHRTKASNSITIECSLTVNNLLGFVFCSVLPQFTPKQNCQSFLRCQKYLDDGQQIESMGGNRDMSLRELNSHHVFLWYDPCTLEELQKIEDDQDTNYNRKISFKFFVDTYDEDHMTTEHDNLIEACGVCPIYTSEYHNFLQQVEIELGTQKKTCHHGIMEYARFSLKFERNIISHPQSRVPKWFKYTTSMTTKFSIFLEIAPDFDCLLGFFFCFVIPQVSLKEKDRSHPSCRCHYGRNSYDTLIGPTGWYYSVTKLNVDNVFLWYDPLYCEFILAKLRNNRGNDEVNSIYNPELKFEFLLGDCLIKECGIRPIYASEYNNFLLQKELKLDLNTGKKETLEY